MFKQLTVEHSLYHIRQKDLHTFINLAEKFKFEEDISVPLALSSIDNHAVVLNVWCMLHEDEYSLLADTEKTMPYASNFHCLNLLKNDSKIRQFLSVRTSDVHTKYILSYYLAYVLLNWTYELLIESDGGAQFIETYMTPNYFLFAAEEQLLHHKDHHFYVTQKMMIKLMVCDYHTSDRYEQYIHKALHLTRSFLTKIVNS